MLETLTARFDAYKDTSHQSCKSNDEWQFRRGEMVCLESVISLPAQTEATAAALADYQEEYFDDADL